MPAHPRAARELVHQVAGDSTEPTCCFRFLSRVASSDWSVMGIYPHIPRLIGPDSSHFAICTRAPICV
eukprot:945528-Pyramimonas_sp.AAC.1